MVLRGWGSDLEPLALPLGDPRHHPLAETISKGLMKRRLRFVGPTIVYAHMQATGMVNDHVIDCFRYHQVAALAESGASFASKLR